MRMVPPLLGVSFCCASAGLAPQTAKAAASQISLRMATPSSTFSPTGIPSCLVLRCKRHAAKCGARRGGFPRYAGARSPGRGGHLPFHGDWAYDHGPFMQRARGMPMSKLANCLLVVTAEVDPEVE